MVCTLLSVRHSFGKSGLYQVKRLTEDEAQAESTLKRELPRKTSRAKV